MIPAEYPARSVAALLRDLDAVRKRLDQAHEWLKDGETSVTVAALAEKAKHLCQQASQGEDLAKLQGLLAEAEECLRELEGFLGLH